MQLSANTIDHRSWVEVDLEQLRTNYNVLKAQVPSSTVIAIMKADAYGHGDGMVSAFLEKECGVSHFAVSNIDEAIALRYAGVTGHILILGYTAPEHGRLLFENKISQTVVSEEYARAMSKTGYPIRYQVAVDTGMNRIGLNASKPKDCAARVRKIAQMLHVEGIFTHLCVADTDTPDNVEFTRRQIERFKAVSDHLEDLKLPYVHCCNSAGSLAYSQTDVPEDLRKYVRLGIVLYGLAPDVTFQLPRKLSPVLSWKSHVSMVKKVPAGESIGYGRSYYTPSEKVIATIPTGYADGYSRRLSNSGYVLVNGCKAPIVGKVCMDQMMVDVTSIPGVKMGTTVTLLGTDGDLTLTADQMAQMIGTIGYEIICNISKRVQRFYKK